ncbi:MAG: flavin reductase family protein [Desulfurococcales archaeon]|nr:flavin reductase family protein [Desulfurococcales archaeon]
MKPVRKPLRMLRPVPIYIISVGSLKKGDVNISTVSWVSPLTKIPPRIGTAIDKSSYTHKVLNKYRRYTLSIVGPDLLELAKFIGTRSGREIDKISVTGVGLDPAGDGDTPYIRNSLGYVLVEVEKVVDFWSTTLFAGRIVEAKAREEVFDNRWNIEAIPFPLHLAKHEFILCQGKLTTVVKTKWGIAMKKPWRTNIDKEE